MSFTGHLDKTVKIKDETIGAGDGMGGYAAGSSATLYKRVKAALVLIRRKDQMIHSGGIKVFAEVYWYMERLSGIREGQEVHWGSRKWAIKLVLPWQEKNRFMKLACVEIGKKIGGP